jgi:RNA polymerase sigma-70 factor (ECF subfamily)
MGRLAIDQFVPASDVATPSGGIDAQPARLPQTLSKRELAKRHAAVCAGAVKLMPDLRAFAGGLASSPQQADDLVQIAIMRALDASRQFTPGTNFRAWIFTILRNAFFNQCRSPISRQVSLDDCESYVAATPATQSSNLEICDFRRAFAQLVPEQREALLLVGVSGLDYGEVAAICGCALGTVKSRVSRARTTLRALMDGGKLTMRRQDLMPASSLDLRHALEASGAGLYLSVPRRPGSRQSLST